MPDGLRWGIMGLGAIAREFAQNMNKVKAVYAAASQNQNRAQAFKKQFNVTKIYTSYEEMLNDKDVDIVYIATVNSLHYENIIACLNAGKHVFCEKAILGNTAQFNNARALAESKGLFFAEAMTIFHMPVIRKARELACSGALGTLKFVEAELGSLKEESESDRYFNKDLGGGAMLDIGTYGLSFLLFFMDSRLTHIGNVMTLHPGGVDESWGIRVRDNRGVIGSANHTFRAKMPKRAIVSGDKAYIEIYNYVRADKINLVYPNGSQKTITEGYTADAMLYEIQNAEKAILGRDFSACRIDVTAAVVSVMDYCLTHPNEAVSI